MNAAGLSPLNSIGSETNIDLLNIETSTLIVTNSISIPDNSLTKSDILNLQSDLDGLQTQITTNTGNIATIETDISNIQFNVNTIVGDVNTIVSDVSGLDMRVAANEATLSDGIVALAELTGDVLLLNQDVSGIMLDISGLNLRVSTNETDISGLSLQIDTILTDVNNLETDISGLTFQVNTNTVDISGLSTQVNINTTNIANKQNIIKNNDLLISYTSGLSSNLSSLQSQINTNIADISGLDVLVNTNISDISGLQISKQNVIGTDDLIITDVSGLQTNLSSLQSQINQNVQQIDINTTNITTDYGLIVTNINDIAALQTSKQDVLDNTDNIKLRSLVCGSMLNPIPVNNGDVYGLNGYFTNCSVNNTDITTELNNLNTSVSTNTTDIDTLETQITGKQDTIITGDSPNFVLSSGIVRIGFQGEPFVATFAQTANFNANGAALRQTPAGLTTLGCANGQQIRFSTNNVMRFGINSEGQFGSYQSYPNGGTNEGLHFCQSMTDNTQSYHQWIFRVNDNDPVDNRIIFRSDFTGSEDISLYANGVVLTSDDRLKSDEVLIENALETIMKLSPQKYNKYSTFDLSGSYKEEYGLIAQDVYYNTPEIRSLVHLGEGANPAELPSGVVTTDDIQNDPDYSNMGWGNEPSHVNYIELIPWLIKGLQELKEENDLLRNRVSQLETDIILLSP